MFNHLDNVLPRLERETIDGVRYYSVPNEDQLLKFVSITSVTSHFNKEIFVKWRKRVGNEEADRITKASTSRGTDMHTLVENYLYNHEGALYSKQLGVAGTTDCIAEFDDELAVIDFKTSKKPKPREWIENYFVQAMFYGMAYYEMTGTPIKKLVIIMACEDGECVVYEEYDLNKYMKLVVEYIKKFVNDKLELLTD